MNKTSTNCAESGPILIFFFFIAWIKTKILKFQLLPEDREFLNFSDIQFSSFLFFDDFCFVGELFVLICMYFCYTQRQVYFISEIIACVLIIDFSDIWKLL